MDEQAITILRRMSWAGDTCPDGVECPAAGLLPDGDWITVGQPVTDPAVLRETGAGPGGAAVRTPPALWRGIPGHPAVAVAPHGDWITAGTLVTDPEILREARVGAGEAAVRTPRVHVLTPPLPEYLDYSDAGQDWGKFRRRIPPEVSA